MMWLFQLLNCYNCLVVCTAVVVLFLIYRGESEKNRKFSFFFL